MLIRGVVFIATVDVQMHYRETWDKWYTEGHFGAFLSRLDQDVMIRVYRREQRSVDACEVVNGVPWKHSSASLFTALISIKNTRGNEKPCVIASTQIIVFLAA